MLDKLNQIDIGTAKKILHRAFRTMYEQVNSGKKPNVKPIFMHSSPGIGKSAIVAQVVAQAAKELNIDVGMHDFRLASCEASDVNGIPYVSHAGQELETMKFSIPDWFPRDQKSYGILFFDELSNAPIAVQHAAYRIIYDRELHDGIRLPDGWLVVAAGNLKTDKTGVKGIAPALANRFGSHLYIKPDVEAFTAYAMKVGLHPHIIGYINFNRDALYRPAINGEDAFASPRSWESASGYLYQGYDEEELAILLSGCVAKGTSVDFGGFREFYGKLPDMSKILAGTETYTVKDDNKGLLLALVTSLVAACVENNTNKDRLKNIQKIVKQLDDEFVIFFFKALRHADISIVNIMSVFVDELKKVQNRIK